MDHVAYPLHTSAHPVSLHGCASMAHLRPDGATCRGNHHDQQFFLRLGFELCRHGGRPRHAVPGADGRRDAAHQPAGQLHGRLLDQPHLRDGALQCQRPQLPGLGVPDRRGHHSQGSDTEPLVVSQGCGSPLEHDFRAARLLSLVPNLWYARFGAFSLVSGILLNTN